MRVHYSFQILQRRVAELERQLSDATSTSSVVEVPQELDLADEHEDPFTVTFHSIIIFGADGNLAMTKTWVSSISFSLVISKQTKMPLYQVPGIVLLAPTTPYF